MCVDVVRCTMGQRSIAPQAGKSVKLAGLADCFVVALLVIKW